MKSRRSGHLEPGAVARFEASLRRATEQVIAVRRAQGEEGDELRADVLADLLDAMTDDVPTLEMIEVEGEPELQRCMSVEEFFREVLAEFGLDGSDMYLQETLYESVRRIVDEALAGDAAGRTD